MKPGKRPQITSMAGWREKKLKHGSFDYAPMISYNSIGRPSLFTEN